MFGICPEGFPHRLENKKLKMDIFMEKKRNLEKQKTALNFTNAAAEFLSFLCAFFTKIKKLSTA